MTTSVLILGATGFIGGHIARVAINRNWEVHGLRRNPENSGRLGLAPITWHTGNLDDPSSLAAAMAGRQFVFHTAGYYSSHNRNIPMQVRYAVEQTRHVLEMAEKSGVERLVYTSSLTTIGAPPQGSDRLADERDFYQPGSVTGSAYYECKIAMEQEVITWASASHQAVVVNPTVVIGPGDRPQGLSQLVMAIHRGWLRAWLPVTINVIDVRDVALAQVAAAVQGRSGQRYILGAKNFSMQEYLNLAAQTLGVKPPRFEIPQALIDWFVRLFGWLPPLASAAGHLRGLEYWHGYNTQKAVEELDLSTRAPQETLRDTLAWMLKP